MHLVFLLIFSFGLSLTAGEPNQATKDLHQLFDNAWEFQMKRSPVWASHLGDKRYARKWEDKSADGYKADLEHYQQELQQLAKIDKNALSQEDRVNYAMFKRNREIRISQHNFGWIYVPLNQRGGIQSDDSIGRLSYTTQKDYEDYLARLQAFPTYMDQYIYTMREGIKRGLVHPKIIMNRIPAQIKAQLKPDVTESGFYEPFTKIPEGLDKADLEQRGKEAISTYIHPSYKKFLNFFEKEYLPACTDEVGIWQMPKGKEMYRFFCKKFTTTDMTPEQIHKIGLEEVARIRAEMMKIIERVEFKGDFAAFLEFLRTDKQFYYDNPDDLYNAYLALSKKIDPTLPKLFRKMPRMPYGVTPIPDSIAPDTTTAYYSQPAADGSRAGQYYVNLYKPETRPIYEMEALSLHEAVPGHHFQIALAMELGELPAFRRYDNVGAYVEGWALYAESLGEDLGFYKDPYSKFGQLTYEMWRAVRLVVDTGIHYMKWDRQKAIDFFMANAAKSEDDIINEIDRYIVWPGQALGYKIGELKIKELRKRAEDKLGKSFDIRAFHDTVLSLGAVPLDVLEEHVEAWSAGFHPAN